MQVSVFLDAKHGHLRRVPHQFCLMTRIDDYSVHPFRISQLSASEQHLIWADRYLGGS